MQLFLAVLAGPDGRAALLGKLPTVLRGSFCEDLRPHGAIAHAVVEGAPAKVLRFPEISHEGAIIRPAGGDELLFRQAGRSKESGALQLLRRESMSKGVFISFNEDSSISIALHIVVDYGVNLIALANAIMNEVSYKVSSVTGVTVKSVDVYFDSMLIN